MNAYTTMGQARIQPRDMAAVRPANRVMVGGSLAGLERERGWQAEAEVDWLLKQHGVMPQPSTWRVATLRQTIGEMLVRAGARLAGVPRGGNSPEPAPMVGTVEVAV
ncbi:MAG: hypothetical protein K0R44_437 [Thermomicrobiales bacterium]|jgi:hypothetical protein|nr:hypothetical protein [Thermomicrobiales bacterium]MDF2760134.1 hypothetical protein [Thermomicrobiales bacterium]MDF3015212.1 hypothetical protein [Thermomicrobiales bacterium]